MALSDRAAQKLIMAITSFGQTAIEADYKITALTSALADEKSTLNSNYRRELANLVSVRGASIDLSAMEKLKNLLTEDTKI